MRAFMLGRAPTLIRKRSQLDSGHAGAGYYRAAVRIPPFASLGWVLTFRSGVGVLLVAPMLAPLVVRIRAEERLLREHFGAEYDEHCKRTWRLIPGVY